MKPSKDTLILIGLGIALILSAIALVRGGITKSRVNESIELSKLINSKPDSLTNIDSLKNEIIQLKFEKESYTANLQMMSDWFIFFETILISIFIAVGFGVFYTNLNNYKKEHKTSNDYINSTITHFKEDYKNLKIEFYNNTGNFWAYTAAQIGKDEPFGFIFALSAADAYLISNRLSDISENKFIKKNIETALETLKNLSKDSSILIDFFDRRKHDFQVVLDLLENISTIDNLEIKGLCADIFSLFKSIIKDKFLSPEETVK